ncbi:SCO3242 family prenyltransferase [Streptomyces amakusaensis]|uniref:SCO3242 family prenyltransferase n=1 Tax=Streptomyces amakusaensis TaxID=67271 RepID=A0ABW0AKS1_9ACTN
MTLLGRIARPRPPATRLRTALRRLTTPGPRHPPAPAHSPAAAAPDPDRRTPRDRARAWAELLRVSALATVPGDTLTGAATLGIRPNRGTALALGASLCLYEAGMALNDWADREEDTRDRPHRPIPSGRVTPTAALTAATVLTTTGLTLAARAGRPALTVATTLAATVWAYDLHLKHTPAGPAAMGAARALDLLLGATATATPTTRPHRKPPPAAALRTALPAALTLAAHTCSVTAVSRHEAHGGSTTAPLTALATTLTIAALTATGPPSPPGRLLRTTLATHYAQTAATPYLHAALNPSPRLTQHAVGSGIRALIPLQCALAAHHHSPTGTLTALTLMTLAPLARGLARRITPT